MWTGEPIVLLPIDFGKSKRALYTLKDKHDLLVIPGGAQGAETMSKHPSAQELVRRYLDKGKLVGMICAGAFDETLRF